jgi:hypothetical protein
MSRLAQLRSKEKLIERFLERVNITMKTWLCRGITVY